MEAGNVVFAGFIGVLLLLIYIVKEYSSLLDYYMSDLYLEAEREQILLAKFMERAMERATKKQ
jgi:hypothetical protein